MNTRRTFLQSLAAGSAGVAATSQLANAADPPAGAPIDGLKVDPATLQAILEAPVLDLSSVKQPVKIASIELLKNGNSHLLRTRSADGLEVITAPH